MKVKIKGLVFVGFAAAILSANAMADDTNTVTSKAYTEATYQHKVEGTNNQLVQSTGTPGSVKYLSISENASDINAQTGIGKVVSGAAIAGAIGDVMETVNQNEVEGSTYINTSLNDETNKTTVAIDTEMIVGSETAVANGTNQLTTAAGVKGYAQKFSHAANQISDGNGGWKSLDSAPAQNSLNGVTSGGVYTAVDAKLNHQLGTADDEGKVLVIDSSGEIVMSAATGDNTYQAKTTASQKKVVGDPNGVWSTIDSAVKESGYIDITADTTANDGSILVNIDANQIAGNQAAVTSGTTQLTTADGVKGYAVKIAQGSEAANKTLVTDAAGNVTVSSIASSPLPAKPAACNDTTPCALVADATGGIHWVPMAQPE